MLYTMAKNRRAISVISISSSLGLLVKSHYKKLNIGHNSSVSYNNPMHSYPWNNSMVAEVYLFVHKLRAWP